MGFGCGFFSFIGDFDLGSFEKVVCISRFFEGFFIGVFFVFRNRDIVGFLVCNRCYWIEFVDNLGVYL